jgi:hypothetical protein
MAKNTSTRTKRAIVPPDAQQPHCGLCGNTRHLTRTDCCGHWICDDEHTYVLFSYARNSCHRNHARYTLCSHHYHEGHAGDWQTCRVCRESFETEMYVWFGTNAYNFEQLKNPPSYQPTRCASCGTVIRLGEDSYTLTPQGTYVCLACTDVPAALKPKASRRKKS